MTAPRLRSRRGLRILPSATTVLAICAGLTSIKFALDGRPHIALALIGAAAVLDGIDGGIARALDAQSRMGAEIDSLADAVNFGVAPALVVYVTLLPTSPIGCWVSSRAGRARSTSTLPVAAPTAACHWSRSYGSVGFKPRPW